MQNTPASASGCVDSAPVTRQRLDSWKQVAAFFRRDVRTVQLWEKTEGLPVRRQYHKRLGSVYAYQDELDCWFQARSESRISRDSPLGRHGRRQKSEISPAGLGERKPPVSVSHDLSSQACAIGAHFRQRRSKAALMKALSYFQDAIDLDPNCADAYAGLTDTYISLSYFRFMAPRVAASCAWKAVDAALKLDAGSIRVSNAYTNLLIHCSWDLARAEQQCQVLLDSGVHDGRTMQLYSSLMSLRDRHDEALHLAQEAYRLDPQLDQVNVNGQIALAYFYAGDFDNALSVVRRTVDSQPEYAMGYALLGRTEAALGNWEKAIAAFRRNLELSEQSHFSKALLAYGYAGSGNKTKAKALLRELASESASECFPAYDVSAVYAALNQEQDAMENIHKAHGSRDIMTIFMNHDPRFAPLRCSDNFKKLASTIEQEAISHHAA